MYNDWQKQQVLTTIKAASSPIRNVEFPSVTFCVPGNMEININASLFKMFYDFLGTEYGIKVDLSPIVVAETINLAVNKHFYLLIFCYQGGFIVITRKQGCSEKLSVSLSKL